MYVHGWVRGGALRQERTWLLRTGVHKVFVVLRPWCVQWHRDHERRRDVSVHRTVYWTQLLRMFAWAVWKHVCNIVLSQDL